MKSFFELAQERYACKNFSDKRISDEDLQKILMAGNLAPTAKNRQPQHIYVLQSEEALAKAKKVTPCTYGAKTVLLVTYDANNVYQYPGTEQNSGGEDIAIVTTHMMLEAKDLGIDTCWVNRFTPQDAKDVFGLPENEFPVLFLDLGYPTELGKPLPNHTSRKDLSELVTYE